MIIRPYIPAMVNDLERWLTKMAADGWRLEDVRGWKFSFRKCKPYTARFCSYSGFGTSYGISNDYLMSKELYSRKKSVINKSTSIIYEVDIEKIDSNYIHFFRLRNKFYLKHYLALLLFSLVCTALVGALMQKNDGLAAFLALGIIPLVYVLLSVIILAREVRKGPDN